MNNYVYYTEAIMLSVMMVFCVHATITDLKSGLVKNKLLLLGSSIALLLDIIYYSVFAQDFFLAFIINFVVMTLLSILFYASHIWAAGDSKLLIFVISLIPARIYYSGENVAATVLIMIAIFSLAFLYYIAESIVIGIKEKSLFSFTRLKFDALQMLVQYIKCTCIVTISNFIFAIFFFDFYIANTELFMIVNMLVVFATCNVKILDKWYIVLALAIATIGIAILQNRQFESVNWIIYLIVLVVVVLRMFAEKYNYKTIPTADVKQGMVLSYGTVILFLPSKIKGLPTKTTEDIRSRISQEEADNIIRWENSKYGQKEITIVRKIPFAIFISVGTVVFVITRMIF